MKKNEIIEKCRSILYSKPTNYPIPQDDFNFLMTLFPLHPDWSTKRGGHEIKAIIIHRHPQYNNKCFALVLDNNEVVDISFTECVNRSGLKDDIISACSSAVSDLPQKDLKQKVKDWIKTFENQDLSIGIYIGGNKGGDLYFTDQKIIQSFRDFYTA